MKTSITLGDGSGHPNIKIEEYWSVYSFIDLLSNSYVCVIICLFHKSSRYLWNI